MQAHRYAIYLAPAEPFHGFGKHWLGRDADTGRPLAPPPGMAALPQWTQWVQAPAHYGLHATLKAPFRMAAGRTGAELDHAMRHFARTQPCFAAPLRLRSLRGFLAWCLDDDPQGEASMRALADGAVRALDGFRAPLSEAELARRRPAGLSAEEYRMLLAWGYPYAFDTFVFHITLTGMLNEAAQREALHCLSQAPGAQAALPLQVDSVSVFVQPEAGADFVVARHYGFDGSVRDGAGAACLA